jgi:membrane protease YdiL (CAAX protease family)
MGSAVTSTVRQRPLLSFFILAYLLNWIVLGPMILSPAGLGLIQMQIPEELFMLAATTPTIAALIVQRLVAGNWRILTLGRPWGRAVGGAVFGLVLALVAYAVAPALILTRAAVGAMHWPVILSVAIGYFANPLNLLGGPLNEEPGWRGFALPRLQARFGPAIGSLVLGALWAGWHVPFFLIQDWLSVPIWAFVALIIALSVLMTWAVNLSGGGIVTAILMHAAFNTSFPMLVGLCRGLRTFGPGLQIYVATAVGCAIVALVATRGRLGPASPKLAAANER